jgi:hypothetical protein
MDEPGGGKRVRLTEPNGYQIEVVCDIEQLAPIPVKRQRLNSGEEPAARAGELMRLPRGPAHVKRIGHGVMMSPKFHETVKWFRETLGMICSDDVYAGEKENLIGSFNRCDRGDDYVDHHVFFCLNADKDRLNHFSFEVPDIDDVCMGHEYLKEAGKYEHMWGIGRHVLGSQVYDYWADPWGRVHEHWADSDRLNLANGSHLIRRTKRCARNGAKSRRRSSSATRASDTCFPSPLWGGARGGGRKAHPSVIAYRDLITPPQPFPTRGRETNWRTRCPSRKSPVHSSR